MTSILRPTVALGIDLRPFVEKLRHREDASEAFKRSPYLASGPLTKIADHQGGTVYKRETVVVEVVSIAGDKDPAKAKGLSGMILIWMSPSSNLPHGQYVRLKLPQDTNG
ncbi:MAG TPA: hypothetical protein VIH54_00580 [Chthoniobacterales bacterium]